MYVNLIFTPRAAKVVIPVPARPSPPLISVTPNSSSLLGVNSVRDLLSGMRPGLKTKSRFLGASRLGMTNEPFQCDLHSW